MFLYGEAPLLFSTEEPVPVPPERDHGVAPHFRPPGAGGNNKGGVCGRLAHAGADPAGR